jgi:uncharacterized protein (TIGR02147 family)
MTIFEYMDYRAYLRDWYEQRKNERPSFSYAVFSRMAGFGNKGFLHNVIHNSKNLSKKSVVKLARALRLSPPETDYFENLVFHNQAAEPRDRAYYFERLTAVKGCGAGGAKVQRLRRDQYEFYSTWYHSAVRSLVDMFPFYGDWRWLARSVYPAITVRQARDSVELLVRLGMARRNPKGRYRVVDKHIATGPSISEVAARRFHRDCARLAVEAMDEVPGHSRDIAGLTLGISRRAYERIRGEAAAFRAKVVQIVNEDRGCGHVYQLSMQLFPLSDPDRMSEEGRP